MTTVILDTNILIYSAKEPFDIENQLTLSGFLDIRVPSVVLDELKHISMKRDKTGRFAALALEIAKRFKVLPSDSHDPADDQLISAARESHFMVATSDASMKRRLKAEGLPVIFLKNGRLLAESQI
jgi:rRNA-processing protein FCF1